MRRLCSFVLLLSLAACGSTPDGPPWMTLDRPEYWRGYNQAQIPAGWEVDRRADTISLVPPGGGDLSTREEYQSFELEFEWMVAPGGNSGVMFHVVESTKPPYVTGPEYQVLDNAGHPDGANPLTRAGANYGLHGKLDDDSSPAGEWNASRLVVQGSRVQHWLNGVLQCDYELWSDDWEELVAASKWKTWTKYGRAPAGYIVLQDHGDPVTFRGMRIRRLQ